MVNLRVERKQFMNNFLLGLLLFTSPSTMLYSMINGEPTVDLSNDYLCI